MMFMFGRCGTANSSQREALSGPSWRRIRRVTFRVASMAGSIVGAVVLGPELMQSPETQIAELKGVYGWAGKLTRERERLTPERARRRCGIPMFVGEILRA